MMPLRAGMDAWQLPPGAGMLSPLHSMLHMPAAQAQAPVPPPAPAPQPPVLAPALLSPVHVFAVAPMFAAAGDSGDPSALFDAAASNRAWSLAQGGAARARLTSARVPRDSTFAPSEAGSLMCT